MAIDLDDTTVCPSRVSDAESYVIEDAHVAALQMSAIGTLRKVIEVEREGGTCLSSRRKLSIV